MFSKTVTNCNLICIFTLILTLPLSFSLNIDEKDFIEDGSSLQEDSDYKNMLKESRNTHTLRYRNLNPNKILKHDSSLDDSVKFKEVKKRDRMKNHAKNLNSRRSNLPAQSRNPILTNEMYKVYQTIDLAIRFRENVVRSLGWMLQVPGKDIFSEEQYSGIHLIYTAVRENLVDFVRLTPPLVEYLAKEAKAGEQQNVEMLFKILSKNLPTYIKCTAHFIVRELNYKRIDILAIIDRYKPLDCYFDYFTEINTQYLEKPRLSKVQLIEIMSNPNTPEQWITYNAVGPIFLTIINHLYEKTIPLEEYLFVSILICMPITPLDPSLEEHIFYLYKLGRANKIPNWHRIDKTTPDKNVYNLIYEIVRRLLPVQTNNYKVIEALFYILNHLREPPNTHMNPSLNDIQKLDEFKKETLITLLETMYFPIFSNDALDARDKLIIEIKKESFDVKIIFNRMNKYRYDNLHDLLLAILTKWQQTVKSSEPELIQLIWIVKSHLILKKLLPPSPIENPGDIHMTDIILPTLLVKETDINHFIKNPSLNNIIVNNRGECFYPKQCLQTSQRINGLPDSISILLQNIGMESLCSSQNSSSNSLCLQNNRPLPTCKPIIEHIPCTKEDCPPAKCPQVECPVPECPPPVCPPAKCPRVECPNRPVPTCEPIIERLPCTTEDCPPAKCPPAKCPPAKCPRVECPPQVCPAPVGPAPVGPVPDTSPRCNGWDQFNVPTIGCITIMGFENITNSEARRQIQELIAFLLTQRYVNVLAIWNIQITKIVSAKDVYEILIIVKDIAGPRLDSQIWFLIHAFEQQLPNLHVTTGIKMIQDGRTVKQMTIDLDNLLKYVLNFKELSLKEQQDYIAVLRYLDRNPGVLTRSKLDLFKYQTKGMLIRYIWTKLMENEEVDENIKQKLRTLLPRIRLDGSGAEKIEIKKLRTLEYRDQ